MQLIKIKLYICIRQSVINRLTIRPMTLQKYLGLSFRGVLSSLVSTFLFYPLSDTLNQTR